MMYSPHGSLAPATVFGFPYPPYQIQQHLMESLFLVLEEKKVGIFESPTGTGKSLTLTCAALHWLECHEALVRQELLDRLDATKKEQELRQLDAESSNAGDWLNAQYEARVKREQLADLESLKALLDSHELQLNVLRERHTKKLGQMRKKILKNTRLSNTVAEEAEDLAATHLEADQCDGSSLNDSLEEGTTEPKYRDVQIFFCSRTHSQLSQVLREVKRTEYGKRMRCISLASRQHLCINPEVRCLSSTAAINERCLDMARSTSQRVAKPSAKDADGCCLKKAQVQRHNVKCAYRAVQAVQELSETALMAVLDIEELVTEAHRASACPYYATRAATQSAQLIMAPYQMLLHKRTREQSGIDLRGAVVIIDEAHNLLDTIAQLHSCELSLQQLLLLQQQIGAYKVQYASRFSTPNLLRINQLIFIIKRLVKLLQSASAEPRMLRTYELTAEGDFFNIDLFEVLKFCERVRFAQKLQGFAQRVHREPPSSEHKAAVTKGAAATVGLLKRLQELHQARGVTNKEHAISKENESPSLVTPAQPQHAPIRQLLAFLEALTENADDGRVLLSAGQPGAVNKGSYKYILLNPGSHFADILKEARAIVIAGGTMQPTEELTKQLFHSCPERVEQHFYDHVVPAGAVLPLVVARGPTGEQLCFKYDQRGNEAKLTELGRCLLNFCCVIPAGVVCFLPSYDYLDTVVSHLKKSGMLESLSSKKQIFHEPRSQPGSQTVEQLLADYAAAIRRPQGGGALLLSVVGGKLSEGLNFADDLGRGVIVVGLPYPNKHSPELLERLKYLDATLGAGAGNEYYENLCMKAINQCIGRSVRHITDYACVCLLDERYGADRICSKLPQWISRSLQLPSRSFGTMQSQIAKFFKEKR